MERKRKRKNKNFRKGDIVKSPVNYRKDIKSKIGVHFAIILNKNDSTTTNVRLLTHDSRGNNEPLDKNRIKGNLKVDDNTYITKDPIKGVTRFFRKIKNCRYE